MTTSLYGSLFKAFRKALFLFPTLATGLFVFVLIDDLGGKGQFGDDVLLGGIAIEGIVLGRNINIILGSDSKPIILYMQAVGL